MHGGNAIGLSQAPPKFDKNYCQTEISVAFNLVQHAPGTGRQGCEGI